MNPRPSRPMRPRFAIATVLIVGASVFAACGSSTKESATSTTVAATRPVAAGIVLDDVWARPAPAGGNTAIYVTIRGGAEDDELIGATAKEGFAESVEIHETIAVSSDDSHGADMHGGTGDEQGHSATTMSSHESPDAHDMPATSTGMMKKMQQVDAVAIPAGKTVTLAPGGYHVMVMKLTDALAVGDEVPVTFRFAKAGEISATAAVREM